MSRVVHVREVVTSWHLIADHEHWWITYTTSTGRRMRRTDVVQAYVELHEREGAKPRTSVVLDGSLQPELGYTITDASAPILEFLREHAPHVLTKLEELQEEMSTLEHVVRREAGRRERGA